MDISSLLKTDLDILNESSFISKNNRLSMYNTIYIFQNWHAPSVKQLYKTYIPDKNKSVFSD